jgi:hypothetical protein
VWVVGPQAPRGLRISLARRRKVQTQRFPILCAVVWGLCPARSGLRTDVSSATARDRDGDGGARRPATAGGSGGRAGCVGWLCKVVVGVANYGVNPTRLAPLGSAEKRALWFDSGCRFYSAAAAQVKPRC